MLKIHGAHGEGGGQIIRSALSLSMLTGTPFSIDRIRAGRDKPGLKQQHLTAVLSSARICGGTVDGATLGSSQIIFRPGEIQPGAHEIRLGTAGSTTLVLQTLLPALMFSEQPSSLVLEGGTHNIHAPPYDFIAKAFLPLVNRLGPQVTPLLERYGFYPAGGGRITVDITPAAAPRSLTLLERGAVCARRGKAIIAHLPRHIAERECRTAAQALAWDPQDFEIEEVTRSRSPGNVLLLEFACEHVTEIIVGFGEVGVRAEQVAERAAKEAWTYDARDVPVGEHLADQLLLPLAVAAWKGGGQCRFRTMPLSRHSETNIDVIGMFLDVPISVEAGDKQECIVTIG